MASPVLCAVLFKFCLPVTLVAAFIFRFNGFSLLYLCCFFCIPLLPSPSVRNCRGNETSHSVSATGDTTVDVILMRWIKSVLSKYWILVCCGAFLLVGLQNDVSMYQIGYMAIFLFLFVCYQVSFSFWRVILRPVWWAMVIYSVCILLVIYTYQFENMPMYWRNTTHLSDEWLYDLGLRQHTKASLLLELLTPTTFSVIIVIQLHFFYRPFMAMIDLRPPRQAVRVSRDEERRVSLSIAANHEEEEVTSANQEEENIIPANQRQGKGILSNQDAGYGRDENESPSDPQAWVLKWYNYMTVRLWRLGELHMSKIISFTLICVVLSKVCAINAVIIVLLGIAMPSGVIQRALSYCFLIWSSLVILAKMCYQLQFVQEDVFQHNCSNTVIRRSNVVNHFTNNALWVGFYKTKNISADIQGYLFIVFVIVLQTVITHHQKLCRIKHGSRELLKGILFPESMELEQADKGLLEMFKYLCNKFFYNFGWEVCIVSIVINMGVRCDAVSVIYSLWLGTFLVLGRDKSSSMWRLYLLFLAVMLPVQYVLVLGWPPGLCTGYPWTNRLDHNLIHWLFLTDPEDPQNAKLLLVDFFQLMLACCQEKVFANERTVPNTEAVVSSVSPRYVSPDFMRNRTWLDMFKNTMMTVEAKQREGDTVWSSLKPEQVKANVQRELQGRQKLEEVQNHHLEDLLKKQNVTAVDIDYKKTNGKELNKLSLVIWVTEKKPESQLNKDDILPKKLEGCVVDVIQARAISCGYSCFESSEKNELQKNIERATEEPPSKKFGPTDGRTTNATLAGKRKNTNSGSHGTNKKSRREILKSGCWVRVNRRYGTLGCFIKMRGKQGICSCKHVFQNRGARVYCSFNGNFGNPIGRVETVIDNEDVDCAFAFLNDDNIVDKYYSTDGTEVTGTAKAKRDSDIKFCGAETGIVKKGVVKSVVWSGFIDGALYKNQIRFSCPVKNGDSGSLLVNESENKAIGLVFAKNGDDEGLANDIIKVLEKLEVTFACNKTDN